MSDIYKKTITITKEIEFIKCDKCGIESPLSNVVDSWAIDKGENYCVNCQKKYAIGFFEKN